MEGAVCSEVGGLYYEAQNGQTKMSALNNCSLKILGKIYQDYIPKTEKSGHNSKLQYQLRAK